MQRAPSSASEEAAWGQHPITTASCTKALGGGSILRKTTRKSPFQQRENREAAAGQCSLKFWGLQHDPSRLCIPARGREGFAPTPQRTHHAQRGFIPGAEAQVLALALLQAQSTRSWVWGPKG